MPEYSLREHGLREHGLREHGLREHGLPERGLRERYPADIPGLRFAATRPGLWRVAAADGTVLGHIERIAAEDGERFLARRARPGLARAIDLGRFCTSRDAAEVFR